MQQSSIILENVFIRPAGFLIVFMLLFYNTGNGQTNKKSKLEQDKKKIEEDIKYTNKLLEETKRNKIVSLNQLAIIDNNIRQREKLVESYNAQIREVEERIEKTSLSINRLSKELESLKSEYAKLIYYAFKNRSSYDQLMFIFASEDFNQAFRRIKYFQQYSEYRKNQVELIMKKRSEMKNTIAFLEKQKTEKLNLLSQKEKEKSGLLKDKEQQSFVVKDLSKKEKEFKAKLKENEKAAKKLQAEIEKIIAEEIKLASEKTGTKKSGVFSLTPEEAALSDNFELNRGKLPWPSERGIVSSTFGEHEHPLLKGVITKNNGVDILTDQGAIARAVFDGVVSKVISMPTYNYVVMVRHGEYLTVYSNLDEVYVKKGDKVKIKQKIGLIRTDTKESRTELHFELWKGKTLLNPGNWLKGM